MKETSSFLRKTIAVGVAFTLACGPVMAGPAPGNLDDLNYQSAEWANEQMGFRGYTLMHNDWRNNRNWGYWWQQSSRTCIRMQDDGRKVMSVETTIAMDCNQKETADKNSGVSTGAKVALGAAALVGIALLASKSHQRDEKNNGQDEKSTAEYERGYRDGLHHERFHNYQNTSAYSDGYNAGQQKRDQETSYRSNSGYHSGNQSYVSLDDLVGGRASNADSDLRSRGFTDKGGYQQDGKTFTTWWNGNTRQCVQAVTKEGRIKRFESLSEGNCT